MREGNYSNVQVMITWLDWTIYGYRCLLFKRLLDLYTHSITFYPWSVLASGYCRCPCPSVCPSVHHQVCPHDNSWTVQASITKFGPEVQNNLVKILASPNLDQRCKTIWLRSLLFYGTIDFQGQIELPEIEALSLTKHYTSGGRRNM